MGVVLAPLPVSTSHEQTLFNQQMKTIFQTNNLPTSHHYGHIAKLFLEKSDGKTIFPKTISMLKKYYEKWKINQQIKHFSNYVKPSLKKLHSQMSKQQVKPPPTRTFSPIKKIPTNVVNAIETPNIIQRPAFTYPTQTELKKMTQKCAAFPRCQFKVI